LLLLGVLGRVALTLFVVVVLGLVAFALLLLVVFGSLLLLRRYVVGLVIAVVEVVAMVMVVTPRDRHRCRYSLSMGARCCRWVVSVVIEGSGRGKKTKTNHEISWFASLHTGGASVLLVSCAIVVVVSSLLFLLLVVVVSPLTSPFLSLAPASPPHRCVILRIRPSSTSSLQPSSLYGSPPDSPSSETNRPHPFGKGRGGLGCNLACEGAEGVLKEPISLVRGEGPGAVLICGWRCRRWGRGRGWWWWWKKERMSKYQP